jgi:hypothetical protein
MSPSGAQLAPGEPLTIIITGTAGGEHGALLLGDGTCLRVPPGCPGVTLVPGDILPDVVEALKTAQRFWEPSDEISDCADCAPGSVCGDHAADRVKSDRYRDVLRLLQETPGGA